MPTQPRARFFSKLSHKNLAVLSTFNLPVNVRGLSPVTSQMPYGPFSQHVLSPVIHTVARASSRRLLHPSRYMSAIAVPPETLDITSTSVPVPRTLLRDKKLCDLKESMARGGSPTRVWTYYTSLLDVLGYEKLPLEIHQEVLRRCTASSAELRKSAPRRLDVGNKPIVPHIHEGRFQTIIRNICATGSTPSLDDYHFILEQFAAVGHHVGSMYVYKEMTHLGLTPKIKTFGLCLQAIAHRLTFPVAKMNQSRRAAQVGKMLSDLMTDMQQFNIPFTSVNLDLTIRILKDTSDLAGFESLMKLGYGIDLSNPDRPPLEYLGNGTISSDLGVGEPPIPNLPNPQPFSTAALNTTIDTLGRMGNISKLIQAFEVLTQPLPQASQHLFQSFDDEDDFGVSDPPQISDFTPPHASPNTTTYNMLLRHLCRAGHAILARHYLNEAIRLDRQTDRKLRIAVKSMPMEEVRAPHFAINRGTLLPVFGESNRDKNVGLMRWLATKLPKILKKKKLDLKFYSDHREILASSVGSSMGSTSSSSQTPSQPILSFDTTSPPDPATPTTEFPATTFLPSSALPAGRITSITQRLRWTGSKKNNSIFELDVDAPPVIHPPPIIKYFNINLHIRILERDVEELEQFSRYVENILGRTTQRLKERLGRRVWSGKDIYLLTNQGQRRRVDRERWREIVRFQPRHADTQPSRKSPQPNSAHISRRAFSTSSRKSNSSWNSDAEELLRTTAPAGVWAHLMSIFYRR